MSTNEFSDIITQLHQVDYINIIKPVGIVVYWYAVSKAFKRYKLNRDYKVKDINKIHILPEIDRKYYEIDITRTIAEEYHEEIEEFVKVILENFPEYVLKNFYNNINELEIIYKKFGIVNKILSTNITGDYAPDRNLIRTTKENYIASIFHELFHMASSFCKDGICYSGFYQYSSKPGTISIGKGINEGYTELLHRRYFLERYGFRGGDSYEYETNIAKNLEKIVGREKMEHLYLGADLPGLVNELRKYSTDEEISKFISNMDFLEEHMNDGKLIPGDKEKIISCIKNVNIFLINCYGKKLPKEKKKAQTKLVKFIQTLCLGVVNANVEFVCTADELISELYYNIMKESQAPVKQKVM